MRIVLVVLMMTSLAMPAYAQRMRLKQGSGKQPQTEEQKKKAVAQEKAYKNALEQIPDQKPADPWGKMR